MAPDRYAALRQQRTSVTPIAAFAVGALLLADMGLFGVVAGSVTRRQHELAVRLALGADHHGVLRLVLREGAMLVSASVLIGYPASTSPVVSFGARWLGVSPWDARTLLAVAVGLMFVTMITCHVPAPRVMDRAGATTSGD